MQHKAKNSTSDIQMLIDDALQSYKDNPIDLLNIGDSVGEYHYLAQHKNEYERTVRDVLTYAGHEADYSSIKVLEIGAFLGIVSIVLAKLGFKVTVTDIEEFISCPRLQQKFNASNIEWASSNLRSHRLPFDDEEYDVVIMCETLEHLNFNPLPIIQEINRTLRPKGLLYLTLPNIASLHNRLTLLQGKSIHNPIKHFLAQLDANDNMIVGLHWREYTAEEIKEMLELMKFTIVQQKYDPVPNGIDKKSFKKIIKKSLYRLLNTPFIRKIIYSALVDPDDPSLNRTQVNLALKSGRSERQFYFTDATK